MLGEAIDQDVAARLGDIEQRDAADYRARARGEHAPNRHSLVGRIDDHLFHVTSSIRRLTLDEPIAPDTHPANTAEHFPASPPATMILIFSGLRNFGIFCASCASVGFVMPSAFSEIPSPLSSSGSSSLIGREVTSWIRARTCALLHLSRAIVSACSGEMTSNISPLPCCFGCQHASSPSPRLPTNACAVREV